MTITMMQSISTKDAAKLSRTTTPSKRLRMEHRVRDIPARQRLSLRRYRRDLSLACRAAPKVIKGKCYVTRDNIDTDQIIPAEYLTLVPSKPEEYAKLGSYAMIGLPDDLYPTRFIEEGSMTTEYAIIVGGQNFGCGSSREHAPVAIGAAGSKAVVAESYARIFFRNCIATYVSFLARRSNNTFLTSGELYPIECEHRLCDILTTGISYIGYLSSIIFFFDFCFMEGMEVELDLENSVLSVFSTGQEFDLKPLGDVVPFPSECLGR